MTMEKTTPQPLQSISRRKKHSMPSGTFADGGRKKSTGSTAKLGDEFKYHYQDMHRCTMKLVELVPRQESRLAGDGQLLQFYRRQD